MKKKQWIILGAVLTLVGIFGAIWYVWVRIPESTSHRSVQQSATREHEGPLRVAFIGDQGISERSRAVLELIRDEEADMVLHQGDFDYHNDPDAWDAMITAILGEDFPYFASVGNHDVAVWPEYQQKLVARLMRVPQATCTGDLGVQSTCTLGDLTFVLSGVGTMGSGHEEFIQHALHAAETTWKVCSWHKNQRLFQTGAKGNEVGWGAYETCREAGAIVATGHEHAYARTHLMSSFSTQTVTSTDSTLTLTPGRSFTFVNGLAGHSIRSAKDHLDENPWWAVTYTEDVGANYGALFCTFGDTEPEHATCFFKNIEGDLIDRFDLRAGNIH